jgi:hypothetical protein
MHEKRGLLLGGSGCESKGGRTFLWVNANWITFCQKIFLFPFFSFNLLDDLWKNLMEFSRKFILIIFNERMSSI